MSFSRFPSRCRCVIRIRFGLLQSRWVFNVRVAGRDEVVWAIGDFLQVLPVFPVCFQPNLLWDVWVDSVLQYFVLSCSFPE